MATAVARAVVPLKATAGHVDEVTTYDEKVGLTRLVAQESDLRLPDSSVLHVEVNGLRSGVEGGEPGLHEVGLARVVEVLGDGKGLVVRHGISPRVAGGYACARRLTPRDQVDKRIYNK